MSTARKVLVRHGNDNYGPYTVSELNAMLESGRVQSDAYAWVEGEPEWRRLHTVPGVMPAVLDTDFDDDAGGSYRSPRPQSGGDVSDKLALPAFLLAFFIGPLGIHRFYAGRTGSGIAMLVLSITVVGLIVTGIWATVDWILIACGAFRDGDGRLIKEWT